MFDKLADDTKDKIDRAVVTELGRLLSSLPMDMNLSKMIAFSLICGGFCLPHIVVMAASLSLEDVFVLPHPRVVEKRSDYLFLVGKTTKGRVKFDRDTHSDPIAVVRLVESYMRMLRQANIVKQRDGTTEKNRIMRLWTDRHGIHYKRMRKLCNLISEISSMLSRISSPHLQQELLPLCFLGKKQGTHKHNRQSTLSLDSQKVLFLKFVLCHCLSMNLMQGTVTIASEDTFLEKQGFATVKNNLDPRNTMIMTLRAHSPQYLPSYIRLVETECGFFSRDLAGITVGKTKVVKQKKREKGQSEELLRQESDTLLALKFRETVPPCKEQEQKKQPSEFNLYNPPIGMRVLRHLFQTLRGEIDIETRTDTVDRNESNSHISETEGEEDENTNGNVMKLTHPVALSSIKWAKFGTVQKISVAIDSYSPIFSLGASLTSLSSSAGSKPPEEKKKTKKTAQEKNKFMICGVASSFTMMSRGSIRANRITLLPTDDHGIISSLMLMLSVDGRILTDTRFFGVGILLPNKETIDFLIPIHPSVLLAVLELREAITDAFFSEVLRCDKQKSKLLVESIMQVLTLDKKLLASSPWPEKFLYFADCIQLKAKRDRLKKQRLVDSIWNDLSSRQSFDETSVLPDDEDIEVDIELQWNEIESSLAKRGKRSKPQSWKGEKQQTTIRDRNQQENWRKEKKDRRTVKKPMKAKQEAVPFTVGSCVMLNTKKQSRKGTVITVRENCIEVVWDGESSPVTLGKSSVIAVVDGMTNNGSKKEEEINVAPTAEVTSLQGVVQEETAASKGINKDNSNRAAAEGERSSAKRQNRSRAFDVKSRRGKMTAAAAAPLKGVGINNKQQQQQPKHQQQQWQRKGQSGGAGAGGK